MYNTEFLIAHPIHQNSVIEAIEKLREKSILFTDAWKNENYNEVDQASNGTPALFDSIINEILRLRDDMKSNSLFDGSDLESALNVQAGKMSKPVTLELQRSIIELEIGSGTLPTNITQVSATLNDVLNKFKHRIPDYANFCVDGDNHYMFICANNLKSLPDCILRFEVKFFCDLCMSAWRSTTT